jgi:hypothetical protein
MLPPGWAIARPERPGTGVLERDVVVHILRIAHRNAFVAGGSGRHVVGRLAAQPSSAAHGSQLADHFGLTLEELDTMPVGLLLGFAILSVLPLLGGGQADRAGGGASGR